MPSQLLSQQFSNYNSCVFTMTKSAGLQQPMPTKAQATLYWGPPPCSSTRQHEQAISFQPDRLLEPFHTSLVGATAAAKSTGRNAQGEDGRAAYCTWVEGKSFNERLKLKVFFFLNNKTNKQPTTINSIFGARAYDNSSSQNTSIWK